MNIIEAIRTRKSIRSFKPDPVSKEILREILETAGQSPSAMNNQPWEFFVLGGDVIDKVRQANVEKLTSGIMPEGEHSITGWTKDSVYRTRQVELAVQLFKLMDIAREDKQKRYEWMERGFRFFDAPAAILIVMDKQLHPTWPIVDMGTISQTIALAALEYGLGTCIMRALVDYPEKVREVIGIPESKLVIVGLIIGYPDWDHPINRLESERESLDDLLTIVE